MTEAQIKAKELVDKFRNEIKWVEKDYPIDLYRDAKQCALICVDEILKIVNQVLDAFDSESDGYYEKVKEEIIKLK